MTSLSDISIALLGAFAGGFLTYFGVVKKIYETSVIQERKDWRETMRRLSQQLAISLSISDRAAIDRLRREMEVRLNPSDSEDREILKCEDPRELISRVSYLLKHDWERAKIEAGFFEGCFQEAQRPNFVGGARPDEIAFCKTKRDKKALFRNFVCLIAFIFLLVLPWIIVEYVAPFAERWLETWREFSSLVCRVLDEAA